MESPLNRQSSCEYVTGLPGGTSLMAHKKEETLHPSPGTEWCQAKKSLLTETTNVSQPSSHSLESIRSVQLEKLPKQMFSYRRQ